MYLEQVTIKGFRLFEYLDLELNPGLNVFVGENDSGKTALIDAIRYVLGSNSTERNFISESDFHKDSDTFTIQLKFSEIENHAHRFVEHISHEETSNESGELERKIVLYVQLSAYKSGEERKGFPYIHREIRSGKDGTGPSLEQEIREFLATTYLKPLRDAEAELSPGRNSRLSQILNSSKEVIGDTPKIFEIIAEANDKLLKDGDALKNSAKDIRDNYLYNLIFESDKKVLDVFIDIAGIRKDNIDEILNGPSKQRHLRTILEGLKLELTNNGKQHGLGYNNLLFMATELLLLEQGIENDFPLLLIEEPEAHLHPQLQMKLLRFIDQRVRSNTNPNGIQCLLTTHSPNLSSKIDPSNIIILGNGKAWSLRFNETEADEEDYRYLRKFLDATKANIFFARGLLLVEGDAENILLPKIFELLGRPLENYGVSIVKYQNSGSWKRFAKLFLRSKVNKEQVEPIITKICVLRDLDLKPKCAENYGFKKTEENKEYWEGESDEETWRTNLIDGLDQQNISVKISDKWTFEYCLAISGLLDECLDALKKPKLDVEKIGSTDEEKAAYIQSKVTKTDFAFNLAEILEKKLKNKLQELREYKGFEELDEQKKIEKIKLLKLDFGNWLRENLPNYIVESIELVTEPFTKERLDNHEVSDEKSN